MSIPTIAIITASLLCSGCSHQFDYVRFDNPVVRELQSEQLIRILPAAAERQSVMGFFAPRVGFLDCGSSDEASVGSGRAAAISSDGYYLTASHVIGDGRFSLEETTVRGGLLEGIHIMSKEEMARIVQTRSYPGRVVWRDRKKDLAIVKFQKKNPKYFRSVSVDVTEGSLVFSADDAGMGVIARGSRGSAAMVGNGPFLVAGKVTSLRRRHRDDHVVITTDMIGRGGMARGAPLANRDGTLHGIVLHVDVNHLFPGKTRTVAGMLSANRIQEIIAADRTGRMDK